MSPGSYFMAANFLDDDEQRAKNLEQAFCTGGLGTGRFRSWAELVEPGLAYAGEWRPDAQPPASSPVQTLYAVGIAHKPT